MSMAISVQKVLTKIFGSRNERLLKRYRTIVAQVNAAESKVQPMTDDQLRQRTQELREGLSGGKLRSADVLHEAMAIIRESMDRNIGIRSIFNPEENFDPKQLEPADRALYEQVQQQMIQSGEPWQRVAIPPQLYQAVAELLAWLHRLESEPAQPAPDGARTGADDVTDVVAVDIEGATGAR